MDDSPLLAGPPEPVVDIARERRRRQEVCKYLSTHTSPRLPTAETSLPYSPLKASLSSDPVLNGLAQLGPLRLGCDRSFVSLLDTNNQYIIAETTRSTPLYQHNLVSKAQEVAFGACAIDIALSICLTTLPVFANPDGGFQVESENVSATTARYIIRDLARHDAFKDRPYVTAWPYLRFYYEVPLLSASGIVLGSYCVIHNERRPDPAAAELTVMQEIAAAIVQHLDQLRVRREHERSSRLLKGLDLFVDGQDSVRQWYQEDYASKPGYSTAKTPADHGNRTLGFRHRQASPVVTQAGATETQRLEASSNTASSATATDDWPCPHASPTTPATTMSPASGQHVRHQGISFPFPDSMPPTTAQRKDSSSKFDAIPAAQQNTSVSDEIQASFSRASNLLRASLDLDGVVYFDGQPKSFGSLVTNNASTGDQWSSLEDTDDATSEDQAPRSSVAATGTDGQFAERLGFSTRAKSSAANDMLSSSTLSMPERDLQYLIRKYPAGHVFLFDDFGALSLSEESSGNDVGVNKKAKVQRRKRGLRESRIDLRSWFPDSVAIAFLPLWTVKSETCVAACFAWSTEPTQSISRSDFTYLTTFGRSVTAEITRLDVLSSDRAKSDFISSVSHELRSPLHGILGSAEMLLGICPDPDQKQIISMIQSCGVSLLETMDQILDFSKINTLSTNRIRRRLRIGQQPTKIGILEKISEFDMNAIIEDVVGAMLVGHRFKQSTASDYTFRDKQEATSSALPATGGEGNVRVILATESGKDWIVRSEAGAWKRILTNLLGNALKYTQRGYIEVRLQSVRLRKAKEDDDKDPNIKLAVLSVKDTGKGISQSYLRKHLFQSFAQEDGLSSGTGLGLSIVKQLVDSLGGTIDISSEVGIGTEITVAVPLVCLPGSGTSLQQGAPSPVIPDNLKVSLLGMDGPPAVKNNGSEAPSETRNSPYSRTMLALKSVLASRFSQIFHASVTSASSLEDAAGDVLVVPQDQLSLLSSSEDGRRYTRPKGSTLLVVCDHVPMITNIKGNDFIQFLGAPYGPRQLTMALSLLASQLHRATHGPFTFTLSPAMEPTTTGVSLRLRNPSDESSPKEPQPWKALKVLLVDDNAINLKLLVMYMTKLGCSYITATNGLEAVQAYRDANGTFDYILMDISMPIMDGFAATREIRALEAASGRKNCVIAALTGLGSTQAQQDAYSSGVSVFLPKPVAMATIKELVSGAIS